MSIELDSRNQWSFWNVRPAALREWCEFQVTHHPKLAAASVAILRRICERESEQRTEQYLATKDQKESSCET